ncbi:hypothetical protein E4100_00890 [Soehngenia longivitae]|uniref:DUF3899 domain-containing protein n=1 Tax=Soehngenia longivitae TaxID=2562294 RepID=A0A4Z0DA49_9FIRM|nr:hypothetical protein [Soehngenia longivitae]TFZ41722.1 hypothetical protein E4100_00890 [Soehngenia longivitae]
MRFKFLQHLILKLVVSIALIYVLDNILFSQISRLNILIAFLGSLFLLFGWINYLSNDGLNIPKLFSNSVYIKSILKKRSNKGVLNIYEDDTINSDLEKNISESIFSNISVGIILIVLSNFIQ